MKEGIMRWLCYFGVGFVLACIRTQHPLDVVQVDLDPAGPRDQTAEPEQDITSETGTLDVSEADIGEVVYGGPTLCPDGPDRVTLHFAAWLLNWIVWIECELVRDTGVYQTGRCEAFETGYLLGNPENPVYHLWDKSGISVPAELVDVMFTMMEDLPLVPAMIDDPHYGLCPVADFAETFDVEISFSPQCGVPPIYVRQATYSCQCSPFYITQDDAIWCDCKSHLGHIAPLGLDELIKYLGGYPPGFDSRRPDGLCSCWKLIRYKSLDDC